MSGMRVEEGRLAQMKLTALLLTRTKGAEEAVMPGFLTYNTRKEDLLIRIMAGVELTPNQVVERVFCEENPDSKRLT